MSKKSIEKIEYLGSIICIGTSIDRDTNNLTVFNIIEEINILESELKKPFKSESEKERIIPFSFEMVTLWKKLIKDQEVSGQVRVDLIDPIGNMIQKFEYSITIKKEHKRLRNKAQIRGLKITEVGEYMYYIYLKEIGTNTFNLVGRVPFVVNVVKKDDIRSIKSIS